MKKSILFLQLAFLFTWTVSLHSSGVFLYEVSPQRLRLGSAGWTAQATEPSILFTNPAGMTNLCQPQLIGALQPIYLNVKFDKNSETTVDGHNGRVQPWIPSAGFYYVKPINGRLTAGVGTLGFFGSALKYNSDWVGRYYLTEASLQSLTASFSVAYRVNSCFSVGCGYTPNFCLFKQEAKVNNILDHLPDGKLRLKESDWGHGYILGLFYRFSPSTRVGLQYLSNIKFNLSDRPDFHDIGPTLESIFEQTGIAKNPVMLNVRSPQMVMLGFFHSMKHCFAIMGDIGWQQWSKFGNVEIALGNSSQTSLTIPKKYRDGWHFAFGTEYTGFQSAVLSAGVAYDTSVVSARERTFDFPIGSQWRFGTGAKWKLGCNMCIDTAFGFQWSGKLPTDRNRGPLAGHVAGNFNNTSVYFFNVSLLKTF